MKAISLILCTVAALFSGGGNVFADSPPPAEEVVIGPREMVCVMSFNMGGQRRWNGRKEAVAVMFEDLKPDVVGLQGVYAAQQAYLEAALPEYEFVWPEHGGGPKYDRMTVMVRRDKFSVEGSGHFWLSDTPGEVSRGWDGARSHMVAWVWLYDLHSNRNLTLFNMTLDARGAEARREGVYRLVEDMWDIAGDSLVFVVGSLAAEPGDEALRPMYYELESAHENHIIGGRGPTWNDWGRAAGGKVTDYIFFDPRKLRFPIEYGVLDREYQGVKYISDHYPVFCTFRY